MLLTPKRRKHRKQMIPSLKGKSTRGTTIAFGEYGLKAITNGYVSNKEIEAARKVVVRHTRKTGRLRIRVFPDIPFTKKGLEMPMGKGKGDVDVYKAPVRRGKVILEVSGLEKNLAKKILISASKKLGIQTRVAIKGKIQ
ncbi:MAG TPA: 50S ribosomal protein L16 [Candidatus Absconditabacterales bacterium]|nr:50S ribosomal protein L16 [Candidatus Absconditabacterales bacterium]HOQ79086.1 50S ribosomal protein L16 [Candidatus Absconditabacterales bacterium]HPK27629.1 50S ribosomal protein L16 [Candidatus Absconditabacterales bacterium]